MINKVLCGGAVLALLSACGSTTGGGPTGVPFTTTPTASTPAAASSDEGFAVPSSFFLANASSGYDSTVEAYSVSGSTISAASTPVRLEWNTFGSSLDFTYKGETVVLNFVTSTPLTFSGAGHTSFPNGLTLTLASSSSINAGNQPLSIFTVEGLGTGASGVPAGPGDLAFMPLGANTDPAEIAALTGTATFSGAKSTSADGGAQIVVLHQDTAGGTVGMGTADGDVTMTADFGAGTISGQIFNIVNTSADPTYGITSGSTLDLLSAPITGNTFNNGISGDATDLGMATITGGQAQGMFYGAGGSVVGGTFNLQGTSGVTGGTANAFGYFNGD